jgi:hypothetical protein
MPKRREQGSRGAGEQGSRGAEEQRSRGDFFQKFFTFDF